MNNLSEEKRHEYINSVIKRYFRMKGWNYENTWYDWYWKCFIWGKQEWNRRDIEDGKFLVSGIVEMYESFGATCE